ncbi:hypothetical protein IT397_00230 [Candidatus Nomurabacteria bacterium]|nr:hypothetical protein [Candidatus Nomurabacteria bacterium]
MKKFWNSLGPLSKAIAFTTVIGWAFVSTIILVEWVKARPVFHRDEIGFRAIFYEDARGKEWTVAHRSIERRVIAKLLSLRKARDEYCVEIEHLVKMRAKLKGDTTDEVIAIATIDRDIEWAKDYWNRANAKFQEACRLASEFGFAVEVNIISGKTPEQLIEYSNENPF